MAGNGILDDATQEADSISTGKSNTLGQVWVGSTSTPFVGPLPVGTPRPSSTKQFVSGDSILNAVGSWYANNDPRYGKIANNLVKAGILLPTFANYNGSVMEKTTEAIQLWQSSNRSMPFGEWLDAMAQRHRASSSGSGGSGYTGPVSSVSHLSDEAARLTLNSIATDLLGRDLTDDELSKYSKKLYGLESSNPSVSSRSTGSSVTTQGLGSKDLATQVIQEAPDYAQHATDTKAADFFLNYIQRGQKVLNG